MGERDFRRCDKMRRQKHCPPSYYFGSYVPLLVHFTNQFFVLCPHVAVKLCLPQTVFVHFLCIIVITITVLFGTQKLSMLNLSYWISLLD